MNTIYETQILIVDDNQDLLHLLCEQLSGAGYQHIQTATNCATAKAAFLNEQPQLMILDTTCRTAMAFPYFELCGLKLILRHYFFPPVMQTQTVYSDLVWVQTITLPNHF